MNMEKKDIFAQLISVAHEENVLHEQTNERKL